MMAKRPKICKCGEEFADSTDYLVHVSGHSREELRSLKRTVACSRCNRDIPAGTRTCECGFVHPGYGNSRIEEDQ
jgi:hypothetical protein